jgi:Domain of unknown function (DUF4337)
MAGPVDIILNLLNKQPKNIDAPKPPPGSRSEREAKIKDKAGLVINFFALLLAVNTWYGGKLSSTIMNNTIKINDVYSFYQAKSIKQTLAEYAQEQAKRLGDSKRVEELQVKIDRYDNEQGEGKIDLLKKAKSLESERDDAKSRSPWIGYANTAYQLAIVVLSASILAVSMDLFYGSFIIALLGIILSSQGLWLWF